MTAKIIQFVPRPNPNRQTLEQQAIGIVDQINGIVGWNASGIDSLTWPGVDTHYHQMYQAPEKDPA
jgi:hypothetical protein